MPRQRFSKPWFHEASGCWCTYADRRRVYLDKDYDVACRKLRQVRAEHARGKTAGPEWIDAPFADLADEFLDDIKARRKPTTHEGYRYRLLRALKILGTTIRVGELRKFHLAKIERELTPSQSPSTVKDTIATVQTVVSWAVRNDLIVDNPLVGYQKPRGRQRTRIIEPAEFRALRRGSDRNFRRVLMAIRTTGCRPCEIRSLIWEWVDLENGMWVLPDHKTVTQQRTPRPRIVPLPDRIWKMCRGMSKRPYQPTDHVFLNQHGKSYTKDCFVKKMDRLRKRVGIEVKAGERIVLYSTRHSYATEVAGRGQRY